MTVHVTEHAIDKYCELIANIPRNHVRYLIMRAERAIACAIAFGAHTVRLGNGAKLSIVAGPKDMRVISVLSRGMINVRDLPAGEQRSVHLRRCGTELRGWPANDPRSAAPVCCGSCGMRAGHPIARACVRTDCPLGNHCFDGDEQ